MQDILWNFLKCGAERRSVCHHASGTRSDLSNWDDSDDSSRWAAENATKQDSHQTNEISRVVQQHLLYTQGFHERVVGVVQVWVIDG